MTIMTITRLNPEKCSRVAQLQTYYTNRGTLKHLSSLVVQWYCVVIV